MARVRLLSGPMLRVVQCVLVDPVFGRLRQIIIGSPAISELYLVNYTWFWTISEMDTDFGVAAHASRWKLMSE